MNILIGCEFSGIVRDAFRENGFNAVSCDLLPTERDGPHIQDDLLAVIHRCKWDVLIAFPDCTFMCNSGVRWLYKDGRKENGPDPERWLKLGAASNFFWRLWRSGIPHIALENPVPHQYAGLPPFTQSIQPYEFGHGETKRTCLWLDRLPPLLPTLHVAERRPRVHYASPGPDRWRERSRTLPGIAAAMAVQWGAYLKKEK